MRKQTQVHNEGSARQSANDRQEGGNHYKQFTHETWDVILDWGLGYLDGNVVKYISRWALGET